jgi:hypothetical protein
METAKIIVSVVTVLIAISSFVIARRADIRSKKAEAIKNLLGEKETVAFAALKLLRDGLPRSSRDRNLVISALMQACVFERSDRARALLYRVIEINRAKYGDEFREALLSIWKTFDSMEFYRFRKEELDLDTGRNRIAAVEKVVGIHKHAEQIVGPERG